MKYSRVLFVGLLSLAATGCSSTQRSFFEVTSVDHCSIQGVFKGVTYKLMPKAGEASAPMAAATCHASLAAGDVGKFFQAAYNYKNGSMTVAKDEGDAHFEAVRVSAR